MAETLIVPLARPEVAPSSSSPSLRAVALPTEHGGWGLLLEPLLLGLLVAPSGPGAAVAVAALGAFLWRHPARLVASDWSRAASYPRTRVALAVAAGYAAVALAAGLVALGTARGALVALIAAAAPFAVVYLAHDLRLRSRSVVAELSGAVALSAGAAAVALAAGWPVSRAFGLWLLVAGRAVGSVVDVRCRLRRQRGMPSPVWPVWLAEAAFVVAAGAASYAGAVPMWATPVLVALLVRSAWNLRPGAPPRRPQDVGWSELRAGLLSTLAWVLAYGSAA